MNIVEKNLLHLNSDLEKIVSELNSYLNNDFNHLNVISNISNVLFEEKNIDIGMTTEYLGKDDRKFLKEIFSSNCLTFEEQKLFIKNNDISIIKLRNELIKYSMWIPAIISFIYIDNGVSYMDLVQEGSLGIIETIKKYKKKNNKAYSTLIIDEIKNKIEKCICKVGKYGSINNSIFQYCKIVQSVADKSLSLMGNEKISEKIAEFIGIPIDSVRNFLNISNRHINIDEVDNEKNYNRVINGSLSMEEEIEDKLYFEQLLEICTSVLNERELFVIKSTFGINSNQLTQKQIGNILGCSYQNVAQIINRSLTKIKKEVKNREYIYRNKQLGLMTINDIKKMR